MGLPRVGRNLAADQQQQTGGTSSDAICDCLSAQAKDSRDAALDVGMQEWLTIVFQASAVYC